MVTNWRPARAWRFVVALVAAFPLALASPALAIGSGTAPSAVPLPSGNPPDQATTSAGQNLNSSAAPLSGDVGTSDSSILLQIARLTDQLQSVEEQIAVDQVHKAVDDLELQQAEQVLRADAIDAFISGGRPGNSLALLAPSPVPRYYTDVVLRRQQDFLTTLHKDESQATLDEKTAVEDYKALDTLNSQLDQERKVLEDRASSDAALALQQQTNLARGIALQQQQQADQQAVNAAAQNGSSLQAGSSFSATESQQTLMGKYPFGPLSTAQLSQYGLVETGQTISGVASWYGPGFDGRPTASGAIYDENGWTCASPDLPFGTLLLVTSGSAGVLVEVNDRGPYADGRVLDLTHAAALAIGSTGLADVVAYVIAPG